MTQRRKLSSRESVFLVALLRHGFKRKNSLRNLKLKHGYVIPANQKEDADGIDFWVKLPKQEEVIPVQVTQRGTKLYQKFHTVGPKNAADFEVKSEERLQEKRKRCRENGVAFVLVRDYEGKNLSTKVAWGDKKALLFGIACWQSKMAV